MADVEDAVLPFGGKISGIAFRRDAGTLPPPLLTASRAVSLVEPRALSGATGAEGPSPGKAGPPASAERASADIVESPVDLYACDPDLMNKVAQAAAAGRRLEPRFLDVGVSADGAWMAALSDNKTVQWRPVAEGAESRVVCMEGRRTAMALDAGGSWLATVRSEEGRGRDEIRLSNWDLSASGEPNEPVTVEAPDRVSHLAIGGTSGDGSPRWLAASGLGRDAWLWDLAAGSSEPVPIPQEERVSALAFSPDGRWLVTGDWDDAARVWDLAGFDGAFATPRRLSHGDAVRAVRFSPDGAWLATGSGDHKARLWDVEGGFIELLTLPHRDAVISLAFDPGSRWFASGSLDNLLRVLPLGRERLHAAACRAAGRNLTCEEWEKFLPGEDYHPTCARYPPGC